MMRREEPERLLVDLSPASAPDEESVRAWAAGQTVFISGVIGGMEAERKAAAQGASRVGARAVLFEDFGGMDDDAEDAYLANVAASDVYLGVLGVRYGRPLKSGYSATHVEYNEAVRRGLRISVWAPPASLDGPQRDFLDAIRVFHTTGSYASPDDLAARVERRLRAMAAESLSPWVKVGKAVFRATTVVDDGTTVTVKARIRDNTVSASLEARRPSTSYGRGADTRITWPGGTAQVRITAVEVEVGAGRARNVTVTATRIADENSSRLDMAVERRTPEDLTELAMRVALLGEPNPLGMMSFMADVENPLPALERLGLPEDALAQVAELLVTEMLVGGRGIDHLTAFRLGPKHQGRRWLLLAWMPRRRYTNTEPVERRIDGAADIGG